MEQRLMDALIFVDFIIESTKDLFQIEHPLIESLVKQLVELGYLQENGGKYSITDAGYVQIVKERNKHVEND